MQNNYQKNVTICLSDLLIQVHFSRNAKIRKKDNNKLIFIFT